MQCAAKPGYLVSFDSEPGATTFACKARISHLYLSETTPFAYIEVWDRPWTAVAFPWHGTAAFDIWIAEDAADLSAMNRHAELPPHSDNVSATSVIDAFEAELVLRRQERARTKDSHLAQINMKARLCKRKAIIQERHRRTWIRYVLALSATSVATRHCPTEIVKKDNFTTKSEQFTQ